MPDVVVVGDADTDILFEVPRLPSWDEAVLAHGVHERPGGKGANTAASVSRLGTSVGFLGCVGDDCYGRIARAGLERAGVDISALEVVDGSSTYYCIMFLDPTGEKAIVVVQTPTLYPAAELVRKHADYIRKARHVHAIGLDPEKVVEALRTARAAGCSTSVDLDSARAGLAVSTPLIQLATIAIVNEQGARNLGEGDDLEATCRRIASLGPKIVVITRGRRGALGAEGSTLVSVPAFAARVVDTTGAGDCFAGAFIHGHLRGWSLEEKLRFSAAAAALCTQEIGGQAALPTEDQVLEFLDRSPARPVDS